MQFCLPSQKIPREKNTALRHTQTFPVHFEGRKSRDTFS